MHSSDRTLLASLGFADADKKDKRHTLACQYLAQPEMMARVVNHILGGITAPPDWTAAEIGVLVGCPEPKPEIPTDNNGDVVKYESGARFDGYLPAATEAYNLTVERVATEVGIRRDRGFLVGFWDVCGRVSVQRPLFRVADVYKRPGECPPMVGWGEGPATKEACNKADDARRAWRAQPLAFVGRTARVEWARCGIAVGIEVKIAPTDCGEIARQMDVYGGEPNPMSEGGSRRLSIVATAYSLSSADRESLRQKGLHTIYLGAPFQKWCTEQSATPAAPRVEF